MSVDINALLRQAMEQKADLDMLSRLNSEGKPLHSNNDYERHLYARRLRQQGRARGEAKVTLAELGLDDIREGKRESYLNDILDSVIVGYSDNPLPVYLEVK